ncbi:MAG TPA: nodulation protein NfeD [Syntrophorhabdales bacterium]|nr:nodulation protein NfeD [Syntrophorhabdales bacterium]
MKKILCVVLFALFYCSLAASGAAKDVYQITVQSVIGPPIAQFVVESIKKATDADAQALLILLDTPGGLDTSMREIIKAIMDSKIPVIVYVYPQGARAASAGSIILLSAHVAAMAPGTNAGAAHPVSIGKDEKPDKVMMKKVVQDAEAYAKSIAKKRGRNVDWAGKAVTQSVSATAEDALRMHVIDVVADSVDDLLTKIDGKTVEVGDKKVTLKTKGVKPKELEISFKYRFLSTITDPNVAYILMMLGFYGILFEIYSPGAIFPGVIGGICLILAFYAFSSIPISFAGLGLILLGIIFFILEIKVVSHGALSLAGVISLILGSVMLIDLPTGWLSISWASILVVVIVTVLFFVGVLSYAIKAQLSRVRTGREGLVGEEGIARTDVKEKGKVYVHGELWNAESDEPIAADERVIVTAVKGMTVKVKKERG